MTRVNYRRLTALHCVIKKYRLNMVYNWYIPNTYVENLYYNIIRCIISISRCHQNDGILVNRTWNNILMNARNVNDYWD